MADCKPIATPMATTSSLGPDEDGEEVDQREYRSMIGSTSTSPCACVQGFRLLQEHHIAKQSSASSATSSLHLSTVFGTPALLPFQFELFQMLILLGVRLIAKVLLALVIF